jgi:hypothetical protein
MLLRANFSKSSLFVIMKIYEKVLELTSWEWSCSRMTILRHFWSDVSGSSSTAFQQRSRLILDLAQSKVRQHASLAGCDEYVARLHIKVYDASRSQELESKKNLRPQRTWQLHRQARHAEPELRLSRLPPTKARDSRSFCFCIRKPVECSAANLSPASRSKTISKSWIRIFSQFWTSGQQQK